MNQPGDVLCYVSPGLRPPPWPPQSAAPGWFGMVAGALAAGIHG